MMKNGRINRKEKSFEVVHYGTERPTDSVIDIYLQSFYYSMTMMTTIGSTLGQSLHSVCAKVP